MLKTDELIEALHDALKTADPACGRFCQAGAEIVEDRYKVHHNGTGSRDTDCQIVYAQGALNKNKEQLTAHLKPWIAGLHGGEKVDLNAAMATGGPITAAAPYIVGERGPEFIVLPARDSMTPGHTHEIRGPVTTGWGWPRAAHIKWLHVSREE